MIDKIVWVAAWIGFFANPIIGGAVLILLWMVSF